MLAAIAVAAIVQMDCQDFTCAAVRGDGQVVVWGTYEPIKELKSDAPRAVPGLDGVKKVVAGSRFFVALKQDGTVRSWGFNRNGVLGDHSGPGQRLRDSPGPVRVSGLSSIVDVEAGSDTAFAIRSDGSLWAWGNTDEGMLGIGRPETVGGQPFPLQVRASPPSSRSPRAPITRSPSRRTARSSHGGRISKARWVTAPPRAAGNQSK